MDVAGIRPDGSQSQQGKQQPTAGYDRSTPRSLVQDRGEQQTGHDFFPSLEKLLLAPGYLAD
jgi:hypothetical protein